MMQLTEPSCQPQEELVPVTRSRVLAIDRGHRLGRCLEKPGENPKENPKENPGANPIGKPAGESGGVPNLSWIQDPTEVPDYARFRGGGNAEEPLDSLPLQAAKPPRFSV